MIDIETNAKKVSDGFKSLSETLIGAIVYRAIYPYLSGVSRDAKTIHRYKRKTGKLERGVREERRKDGGSVFVDDTYAHYGKYVHMGQRSWAPDEFVFRAGDANERDLDNLIDKAVDDVLKRSGL